MPIRADVVSGRMYHVFTKSIAGFIVFNNDAEYDRMIYALNYYKIMGIGYCYSDYIKHVYKTDLLKDKDQTVDIIAYCLMPTHLHFILKQNVDKGISLFMRKVLNSYSKYFNCKIKRKGPLWESRFKNVKIENDEQLMHLTRYVHLNPVTANLVKKPNFWKYSSYNEYLNKTKEKICNYGEVLDIDPGEYKEFVGSQIDHQKN